MRVIRPLYVARLLALLFACGVFAPAAVDAATARKKTTQASRRVASK